MEAVMGGVIIGISVSIMLLYNGRVTGISGIIGGTLNPSTQDKWWRLSFLGGLVIGGVILKYIYPEAFIFTSQAIYLDYAIGGFLVGFGTLLGNGCTSGHGVCGISRLSIRSIIATFVFIAVGVMTVNVFKLVRGGL